MSTKNLARTVIEGGRQHYNQFDRRNSNVVARARAHRTERALRAVSDVDAVVFEPRTPVWRAFSDKLGPARRWLRSQVGRPWNKVTSDLFQRFDVRTTAGRHIVFCHLLQEVNTDGTGPDRRHDFFVNARGILRYERFRAFGYARREALPEPQKELCAWLAGRRVLEHGERLYWLELTPHDAFRQSHELSASDARRWRSLPTWFREEVAGPLRLDPNEARAQRARWS